MYVIIRFDFTLRMNRRSHLQPVLSITRLEPYLSTYSSLPYKKSIRNQHLPSHQSLRNKPFRGPTHGKRKSCTISDRILNVCRLGLLCRRAPLAFVWGYRLTILNDFGVLRWQMGRIGRAGRAPLALVRGCRLPYLNVLGGC
jgi:hypothetical protein